MLVLGHGAGSAMTSPFLTGFSEQIAELGLGTPASTSPTWGPGAGCTTAPRC